MTIETDDLKRLIQDGVGPNRATLEACLPELVSEIESLREKVRGYEYLNETKSYAETVL